MKEEQKHKEISHQEMADHFQADADFQLQSKKFQEDVQKTIDSINTQLARMEPMIQLFETNNVVSVEMKKKTQTIVFYIKSATTVAVFLASLWYLIKSIR